MSAELKFAKSHEWILEKDGRVKIGISDYAQKALGDIVFVDLPEEGDEVDKEVSFAEVESVKAVSEVFSPVSGIVCAVNTEVSDSPEKINENPYDAWLIEVEDVADTVELLTAEEYEVFCRGLE